MKKNLAMYLTVMNPRRPVVHLAKRRLLAPSPATAPKRNVVATVPAAATTPSMTVFTVNCIN
jgi:hypothetical protein